MSKGIVYYTHNKCREDILSDCRKQIDKCRGDMPLVTVSWKPMDWGYNIVFDGSNLQRDLAMFKQQLIGLEAIDTDYVFFCEHDVLYHKSHFNFTPLLDDAYYFNLNFWVVDADNGKSMHYHGLQMTSGLVAHRSILIEHYTKKIQWVEEEGKFSRQRMGYEPGKRESRKRLGNYRQCHYWSDFPNVDIKHGDNITRKRFNLEDFRSRRMIRDSWILANEVPYWGRIQYDS